MLNSLSIATEKKRANYQYWDCPDNGRSIPIFDSGLWRAERRMANVCASCVNTNQRFTDMNKSFIVIALAMVLAKAKAQTPADSVGLFAIHDGEATRIERPAYSVKNFDVARFEVKKGKRMLTGVTASITGSKVGVSAADDLQVETAEVRTGVYDVTVKGKPGEYCLMFTANGTGGFGGVFDFTIK